MSTPNLTATSIHLTILGERCFVFKFGFNCVFIVLSSFKCSYSGLKRSFYVTVSVENEFGYRYAELVVL